MTQLSSAHFHRGSLCVPEQSGLCPAFMQLIDICTVVARCPLSCFAQTVMSVTICEHASMICAGMCMRQDMVNAL